MPIAYSMNAVYFFYRIDYSHLNVSDMQVYFRTLWKLYPTNATVLLWLWLCVRLVLCMLDQTISVEPDYLSISRQAVICPSGSASMRLSLLDAHYTEPVKIE